MATTRYAWLMAAAMLAAGCGQQEVFTGLTQRQANEVTAALRAAGIDADKQSREAGQFAVVAPRARFAEAVDLLKTQGLPRDGYDSLGQVFKKEGFVSSPLEERARLQHALSQEIAYTLSTIDGVVIARVHLSVPERDPLAEKQASASASVFIKHRAEVDLASRVGQIKALVINALPSLPYDNVTVALFPAEAAARPLAATDDRLGSLGAVLWTVAVVGLLAAGAGAGLWWWQRRRPEATGTGLTEVMRP